MPIDTNEMDSHQDRIGVAEEQFLQAEAVAQELVGKLSLLDERAESFQNASLDLSKANEHLAGLSSTMSDAVVLVQRYIEGLGGIDHNSILRHIDESGHQVREKLETYLEALSQFQQELSNTVRSADSSVSDYKRYLGELQDQVRELEQQISYSAQELPRLVDSSIEQSNQIISGAQDQIKQSIESLSATNTEVMQQVARSIHEPLESLDANFAKIEAKCQQISNLQDQTKQSIESLCATNAEVMQQTARSVHSALENLGAKLDEVRAECQQIQKHSAAIPALSTRLPDNTAKRLDNIQKACWICCSLSLGALVLVLLMMVSR